MNANTRIEAMTTLATKIAVRLTTVTSMVLWGAPGSVRGPDQVPVRVMFDRSSDSLTVFFGRPSMPFLATIRLGMS